ncbi:MAG: hypothetical protein ACKVP6_11765, partial [Mycobacterium sp.]
MSAPRGVRTLTLWCPDWPVAAAMLVDEVPLGMPVAVLRANRVVSASVLARAAGVRRGMRRREAQARCPDIEIVADDPGRDARAFEPVVAAVEVFTPLVEIVRPGLLQFSTRGPARYFGGDEPLAERVAAAVAGVLGCISSGTNVGAAVSSGTNGAEVLVRISYSGSNKSTPEPGDPEIPPARIGIADGPFAAAVAARVPTPGGQGGVHIVNPGHSPAFLAPLPVSALAGAHPDQGAPGRGRLGLSRRGAAVTELDALRDMAELMVRLGITTLGQLVALPPA